MSDTLTATIADAIVDRLDLDALAARIADHLRSPAPADARLHADARFYLADTTDPGFNLTAYNPDQPVPYSQARAELGGHIRRGHPISYPTFQKYIASGRLTPVSGPSRAKCYVRRGDLDLLIKETAKR
mgnify:FL=1